MTAQPVWKVVSSTDDTRILADETGVYPPELEYVDEVYSREYMLFRVPLERFTLDPVQLELFERRPGQGHHLRLVMCVDSKGVTHAPWFEDDLHKGIDGVHVDNRFCEPCGQWVSHNLTSAASSTGEDPDELRRRFCSEDVHERAWAYGTIAGCHGWENFDSYPLTLTGSEMNERWGCSGFDEDEEPEDEESEDEENEEPEGERS